MTEKRTMTKPEKQRRRGTSKEPSVALSLERRLSLPPHNLHPEMKLIEFRNKIREMNARTSLSGPSRGPRQTQNPERGGWGKRGSEPLNRRSSRHLLATYSHQIRLESSNTYILSTGGMKTRRAAAKEWDYQKASSWPRLSSS